MRDQDRHEKILDWYDQYHDDIYRYIYMMIGDHNQAKDLTHDAYVKAFKNLSSMNQQANQKSWLYSIARNLTIDYIRKKKPLLYMFESFISIQDKSNCPEKIAQLGEDQALLYQSISSLKRPYREVIILRKVKELTIQESAEILNWSESKVKVTLFRALDALKKKLEEGGYEYD